MVTWANLAGTLVAADDLICHDEVCAVMCEYTPGLLVTGGQLPDMSF